VGFSVFEVARAPALAMSGPADGERLALQYRILSFPRKRNDNETPRVHNRPEERRRPNDRLATSPNL
jgi:hypothetical protein